MLPGTISFAVGGEGAFCAEGGESGWLMWFLVSLVVLSSRNIIRVFKLLLLEASASPH